MNKAVEQYKDNIQKLTELNFNNNNQINALRISNNDLQSRLYFGHNQYEKLLKDHVELKEGYNNILKLIEDNHEKTYITHNNLENNQIEN